MMQMKSGQQFWKLPGSEIVIPTKLKRKMSTAEMMSMAQFLHKQHIGAL